MGLKASRAAAKAKARRAKNPKTETRPKTAAVKESGQATMAALKAMAAQHEDQMSALTEIVQQQGEQIKALLERPVSVESGPVEVNVPTGRKASSYKIEYNQNGRPARLIPEYETAH